MKQLRIHNGFDRMSDADLQAKTGQIIADLSANFATAPGLPTLITASEDYSAALDAAINGSRIQKAIKNQKKSDVVFQHHQMIAYVILTSAGDRVMAAKSGYTLVSETTTPGVLTQPGDLKVVNGMNAGELLLSFKRPRAAVSFIYQCTPEPLTEASEWQQFYGNKRQYLFTGLETGKRYWVRVAVLGKDGEMIFSEPVLSKLVQ